MGYHGCGDNYCVLGPPEKGTGTNGGCSCFDALLLRRGVLSLRAELAEVVIERSEADSCRRKEAERADAAEAEVERLRARLADPRLVAWHTMAEEDREPVVSELRSVSADGETAAAVLEWAQEGGE